MKKKILVILVFLLLFSSVSLFAQAAYKHLGIGIYGINPYSNEELQNLPQDASPFDDMFWGLNFTLKTSNVLGFMFDLIYVGTQYYYQDYDPGTGDPYYNYWYGPDTWDIASPYVPVTDETEWDYYQDQFLMNLDLAIFLPIWFLEPYFAIGPTFLVTTPSDAYDSDPDFANYYDYVNGDNETFGLGYNIKLGIQVFVSKSIALGFEYFFLVDKPKEFFNRAFGEDPDPSDFDDYYGAKYINNQSHFAFSIMLWL